MIPRCKSSDEITCRAILPAWGAGPYLPALVLERPIFVREMSDGLYTAFTYLTYKVSILLKFFHFIFLFASMTHAKATVQMEKLPKTCFLINFAFLAFTDSICLL